ncbi:MAG: hypothetical protein P4L39_03365 [Humidesulfovibrio sp.]|nr:hypothetical protein [Humidesulfovibrio sp.]
MRFKSLLAGLALALTALGPLYGCMPSKDWMHPRIADPRKEDKQFVEDTQFCEDKIGPQKDEAAHKAALDDCYRRLGWQRKD